MKEEEKSSEIGENPIWKKKMHLACVHFGCVHSFVLQHIHVRGFVCKFDELRAAEGYFQDVEASLGHPSLLPRLTSILIIGDRYTTSAQISKNGKKGEKRGEKAWTNIRALLASSLHFLNCMYDSFMPVVSGKPIIIN